MLFHFHTGLSGRNQTGLRKLVDTLNRLKGILLFRQFVFLVPKDLLCFGNLISCPYASIMYLSF